MSDQFKIGEVVIGQNHIFHPEFNGMECTITGGLKLRSWVGSHGSYGEDMAYFVEWANGRRTVSTPFNLRRKRPPAGEQSIFDMFKMPAPVRHSEVT